MGTEDKGRKWIGYSKNLKKEKLNRFSILPNTVTRQSLKVWGSLKERCRKQYAYLTPDTGVYNRTATAKTMPLRKRRRDSAQDSSPI